MFKAQEPVYNWRMTWNLFLDDEREPTHDLFPAVVARDCDEAIALILEFGVPKLISFDHDLGNGDDGVVKPSAMTLMWFLIDSDLDGILNLDEIERIIVHSRNETGAKNLAELWNGYSRSELTSGVLAEIRPRRTLTN